MGLFWKSDSDRIIEQVQELVGRINQTLLSLQNSLVANHGATDNNIFELNLISENLLKQQNQLNELLANLTDSQQMKTSVAWIDGRYFPLPMWMMSYNAAVGKLQYALKKYYGNSF